jgi:hypothetical protein
MHIKVVSFLFLFSLSACFLDEPTCDVIEVSAITFDGDISGDSTAATDTWNVADSGMLETYWLNARAGISLTRSLPGVERVKVYATGYEQRETYVGITASIVGFDPHTGESKTIGESVIARGGSKTELQALELRVEPGAYDWPDTLLMVTSTGTPGERLFAGATLYRDCD